MHVAIGYRVVRVVKEVGSGLNDHRRQLEKLLKQDDYNVLIVEHRARKRQVRHQLPGCPTLQTWYHPRNSQLS